MTIELLALIAGALLSLAFSYIPGLKDKFGALAPEVKRSIMIGLLIVVACGVFGLSCAGWLESLWPGLGVTCTQEGALALVKILILALVANQGTYAISPRQVSK